jgi:hypothetical protein
VPTGDELPPGVSDSRLENQSALLVAHADTLAGRNYTATTRRRIDFTNGTTYSRVEARSLVAADDTHYLSVSYEGRARDQLTAPSPVVRFEEWTNDSVSLERTRYANGTVRYDRTPGFGTPSNGTGWLGGNVESSPVRVESGSDGVVLTMERPFGLSIGATSRGAAHHEAVVGPDGRIRSTSIRSPIAIAGRNATVTRENRVRMVDETAHSKPPWFREAIESTEPVDG